eukprot:gene33978-29947_t
MAPRRRLAASPPPQTARALDGAAVLVQGPRRLRRMAAGLAVITFRGCVGGCTADHVNGSYAAVMPCAEHCQAAALTAWRIDATSPAVKAQQRDADPALAQLSRT